MNAQKIRLSIDIAKFAVYLISLIIALSAAYNSIDKRLSIIESEMKHKVDLSTLIERLDILKYDISRKIENEVEKVKGNENKP